MPPLATTSRTIPEPLVKSQVSMKAQNLLPLTVLLGSMGLFTCQPQLRPCTTIFQGIGLKVTGDTLTDFYSVRLATSDTIRRSTGEESRFHSYLVLDDSYQPILANKQESFRFIGKIGPTIVVAEDYLIEADHCHIHKVSGKNEVQL